MDKFDYIEADIYYNHIFDDCLYPYHRPDIQLADDKIFLIAISYGSHYEYYYTENANRIYIDYRTSYHRQCSQNKSILYD